MGLYIIPYAVDLGILRESIGSRNAMLLAQVAYSETFQAYSEPDASFPRPEDYQLGRALEQLIMGTIPQSSPVKTQPWWQRVFSASATPLSSLESPPYGYAILVLCDYLGTHLHPNGDGFYLGRNFEAAISKLKRAGLTLDFEKLIDNRPNLFTIPGNSDFPAIGHFDKSEVAMVNAALAKIPIDPEETDFANPRFNEVSEMIADMKYCFEECAAMDLEMVTFTHLRLRKSREALRFIISGYLFQDDTASERNRAKSIMQRLVKASLLTSGCRKRLTISHHA